MPTATPQVTSLMRALADPTRRAVFERIVEAGEATATSLVGASRVSQPAVSQHLRALREAGLVAERRSGRHVHYRAAPDGLAPLNDWLSHYSGFWRHHIGQLEALLKEMDP